MIKAQQVNANTSYYLFKWDRGYYTPEVRGSSVWQISKKYFAGMIYGQKSLMC